MENRFLEICDPAAVPEGVRAFFSGDRGRTVSCDGAIWARAGKWILRCEPGEEAEACLRDLLQGEKQPETREEAWEKILTGCTEEEAERLARRFQLPGIRCARVIVFIPLQEGSIKLSEPFQELTPLEEGDVLIPRGEDQMILIKRLTDHAETEVSEYASALLETMESEAGIRCLCGIGNDASGWQALFRSYQEALEAVDTGLRFHLNAPVFLYQEQTLERLLDTIPKEKRQRLRAEVFRQEQPLSAEMMETARTFFRNDLNLTTTAKELFIHRNTLLYRLERIRKETGLDVRSFHDAVIFSVFSALQAEETPSAPGNG
jgi:sugar diacid utilization regulator